MPESQADLVISRAARIIELEDLISQMQAEVVRSCFVWMSETTVRDHARRNQYTVLTIETLYHRVAEDGILLALVRLMCERFKYLLGLFEPFIRRRRGAQCFHSDVGMGNKSRLESRH